MRFGLGARFIGLTLAILSVIFTFITIAVITVNTARLRTGLVNDIKAFSALAAQPIGNAYILYADSGRIRISQEVEKFTDLDPNITNIEVVDVKGKKLFAQNDSATATVDTKAAGAFEPTYYYDSNGNPTKAVYPLLESYGLHRYAIVYYISASSLTTAATQTAVIIILFALLALLVVSLLTYLFVNKFFLAPIKKVSVISTLIALGKYDQQIKLERGDEIGDLADNVNSMANKLKDDIRKLREIDELKSEFLRIASHYLRTPLTSIEWGVELLQDQALNDESRRLVSLLAASAQRLSAFTEDINLLASLEAGKGLFGREKARASEIFSTLDSFETLAKAKDLHYVQTVDTQKRVMLAGMAYLRTALWNVLDNALKFTSAGGNIRVEGRVVGDNLIIKVVDDGEGITPKELNRLFTKFHRGTETITLNYEGTGIGLYLTKLILDYHHGEINVSSLYKKGTTVIMKLPLLPVENGMEASKKPTEELPALTKTESTKPS